MEQTKADDPDPQIAMPSDHAFLTADGRRMSLDEIRVAWERAHAGDARAMPTKTCMSCGRLLQPGAASPQPAWAVLVIIAIAATNLASFALVVAWWAGVL